METKTIFRYPTALTIAGSDSSGGAGIQADLKTFSALGVFGASVITAITAQNTQEVRGIQVVSPDILQAQLDAIFDDLEIDAIKTGMIPDCKSVKIIADVLSHASPLPFVIDPVMISTSGKRLIDEEAVKIMQKELFPLATLITPNIEEVEYLTGYTILSDTDMEQAALCILETGCKSVLIKGGHLNGQKKTDILFVPGLDPLRLSVESIYSQNTHGTGCTLASAITAHLALGHTLIEAVRLSKIYLTEALKYSVDISMGEGHGPVNHFYSPIPLKKVQIKK